MSEPVDMAARRGRSVDSQRSVQTISSRQVSSGPASEHETSTRQPSYEDDMDIPAPSEQPNESSTLQHVQDDAEDAEGSKAGSIEAVEKNEKKRAAEEQSEGSVSKKAKVGEESGQVKEPAPENKSDLEDKIQEYRKKANKSITERNDKIKELRADLEAVEEKRDDWHTECIELQEEIESLKKNDKERQAKSKSVMKAKCAAFRAELEQEFEERLKAKSSAIEKKCEGKIETMKKNFDAMLEKRDARIADLTMKLKESKASHAEDNKEKNAALVEARKVGGPRAKQDLKDMKLEIKDKENEVKEIQADRIQLLKRITFLNSEVNAAKTLEKQADSARDNTFEENRKLQVQNQKLHNELASWKAKAVEARQDGPIREQQLQGEIKRMNDHYKREMQKLQEQATAGVAWRRSCVSLRQQNDKNNEERAAMQKKLENMSAEKAKLEKALKPEQSELQKENSKLKEAPRTASVSTHAASSRNFGDFPFVRKSTDQAAGATTRMPHGLPNLDGNGTGAANKARGWNFPDDIQG